MAGIIKAIWSIFRHKWYVFLAGLKVGGIPAWRLLFHDISKFSMSEFPVYKSRILNNGKIIDRGGWAYAWHHHYMRNPHHWEHWVFYWQGDSTYYEGIIDNKCLPMPETCAREMIADWMGASRLYTGSWDITDWLLENLPKMKLHPETEGIVYEVLDELGFWFVQEKNWNGKHTNG